MKGREFDIRIIIRNFLIVLITSTFIVFSLWNKGDELKDAPYAFVEIAREKPLLIIIILGTFLPILGSVTLLILSRTTPEVLPEEKERYLAFLIYGFIGILIGLLITIALAK